MVVLLYARSTHQWEKVIRGKELSIWWCYFGFICRTPTQKFSLGVYSNSEFFGLFVVPLVGIDWKIDDRNYLFGVFPGRLSFEHQWDRHWYSGLSFRAPTNSYRITNGEYIRLDDAQLSLFLDYYLTKHLCLSLGNRLWVFPKTSYGHPGPELY